MKIYNHPLPPNPRRVRIFLAEKGVKVPYEDVDILAGKNRAPEFLRINPLGGLPVLELDDGGYLAESVAICRYFEALHPEPPLMGTDVRDRAFVEMWNRRMELNVFGPVGRYFQHASELFKTRLRQIPEYAASQREEAVNRYNWLDSELASRKFVAGDRFTIADITLVCAIDLGKNLVNFPIPADLKNLNRWYGEVSSRPSAKA
jgi:glutathione S-transferase